ncbi:hypothetical protein BH11GEM2_BH11GEM2_01340 [soil metagenome]
MRCAFSETLPRGGKHAHVSRVSANARTRTAVADPRRLAALARTGLLDARPSDTFDRLTTLATRLLGVPMALVSLIDDDRQFFVSCPGLGEPWATARETPLSHSFCQFVVATGEPLVVEDARTVDFLQSNLAIRDLGVIAYAGVPLRLSTGEILGSFCAIERVPRAWTPAELESLQTLADAAMAELDLRETSRLLAERESQLRVLLDNSEELVCSFGAPGEIVYVNRAPAHVTGQRHSRGHDRRRPGHARPRRGAARRRRHSRRRHVGARDAVEDARDRTARCVDPRRGQRKGLDRATTTTATPDLAP